MVNWARAYDWFFETDRVPELLERLERGDDAGTWAELAHRLVLEADLVSPAGFAALPQLVRLAAHSAEARILSGKILERAAGHHDCDDLLAQCADAIAEFRELLDQHLRSRPSDYLAAFRALLAVEEQYHWAAVLGDFTDDFYAVGCPHCAAEVTIAIGDHGRYSAIRDWHQGDVNRRPLRPAPVDGLSGIGRLMYDTALRDGKDALVDGVLHLFGGAQCPSCGSVFSVADEYASAHRPALR
ncbi:hypothetical protein ABZT03_21310 [Streptomyces sp. NPDC005574]|uniref:hypothetical protein n=1 Tax=Streptomyces sp. NPDC005574 TaxID=3156891 RepID=UPI0033B9E7B7